MSTAAPAKTPTKPQAPAAAKTPSKSPCVSRARCSHTSENSNPNIGTPPPPQPSPTLKSPAAAGARSATAKKMPAPAPAPAPPAPERERRFLVAKGARRRRNREAAHEALRASQKAFFRNEIAASTAEEQGQQEEEEGKPVAEAEERQEEETDAREALRASQGAFFRNELAASTAEEQGQQEGKPVGEAEERQEEEEETDAELEGSSKVRAMRTKAMAMAMSSVPDPGSGRVKHMVQAFESLLNISGATSDAERAGESSWALPGLQKWKEQADDDLGFPRLCLSLDGNTDRLSWDSKASAGERRDRRSSAESLRSRTSAAGRRSRRNSSESLRSSWNKKLKVTSQHPFKLRTEQRGKFKEQQFVQKVQEMLVEEEKKRIHIAQGLPWTTDEPECLIKPAVKQRTEPIDLVLHSDVRALERAEFDHHVLEKNKFAEQQRLEWERQQELEEEERIRQLRRTELIPKAQPMPYFDRPFVPKRSTKPTTVPVEPKFHLRPEKLSCVWSLES